MSVIIGLRSRSSRGFTLVELIISMVIMGILSIAMVGAVGLWLGQYSVGNIRQQLTANLQASLTRMDDDIRQSTSLLSENSVSDSNAPSPPGKWVTGSNLLVIGKTPRDSSGNGLYSTQSTFAGTPDNFVYYLNNGSIYRRIIPANYIGNVNLPLATCSAQSGGGCPSDIKIVSNVNSVVYTFLDQSGNTTTDATKTKAVKVDLELRTQQSGQTITVKNSSTIAFRSSGTSFYTTAPFAVGPGSLELVNGAQIGSGSTKRDMYVKGKVTFSPTQTIGTSSQPLKNVYIGNQACGSNYTDVCTTEPVSMGFGSIYADNICATGQTTASTAFGVLQTLTPNCTAPSLELPLFNKAGFTSRMTSTAGSATCTTAPYDCNVTLPANTKYTGSIGGGNARLNLTITGDLYVMGNFGNLATGGNILNTTITVAEGVTTRPIIVVNGRIGLDWTTVNKNSSGISPIFISFYSADAACSASDTCTDRTTANIYNSLQQSSYAIDLSGPSTMNATFYAYYGTVRLSDQGVINGTVAGQRVRLENGLAAINLTDDTWPN